MVKADSGGVKSALSALNRGEILIMASDQVPKKSNGIISNFFGIPALSVSLISSLAIRTKSPCHSVSCIRLKKGKGYRIIFSERLEKLNTLGVQQGVNLMNTELEECIMKAPEQYAWEYKRFKHSNFKNPY
jgi:KDO2-lipid IV(A) lauroyltransferase